MLLFYVEAKVAWLGDVVFTNDRPGPRPTVAALLCIRAPFELVSSCFQLCFTPFVVWRPGLSFMPAGRSQILSSAAGFKEGDRLIGISVGIAAMAIASRGRCLRRCRSGILRCTWRRR